MSSKIIGDKPQDDLNGISTGIPTYKGAAIRRAKLVTSRKEATMPSRFGWRENAKEKVQSKLPHHTDTKYARQYQLRYDIHIKLDSILDKAESWPTIVNEFKDLFIKIIDDEPTAMLYPYSTPSSIVSLQLHDYQIILVS